MFAIVNCLTPPPPPQKKGVALRGFLGTCPSVKKNVYKFAKQANEAFKTLAPLTKGCEIELPFMLTTDFFFFLVSIACERYHVK